MRFWLSSPECLGDKCSIREDHRFTRTSEPVNFGLCPFSPRGVIRDEMALLANLCWPFHQHVIEVLRPRVILCFGKTAGKYVRYKLGANIFYEEFIEQNNRQWRSQTFTDSCGLRVVIATHPSIANWSTPNTDPTELIRNAMR